MGLHFALPYLGNARYFFLRFSPDSTRTQDSSLIIAHLVFKYWQSNSIKKIRMYQLGRTFSGIFWKTKMLLLAENYLMPLGLEILLLSWKVRGLYNSIDFYWMALSNIYPDLLVSRALHFNEPGISVRLNPITLHCTFRIIYDSNTLLQHKQYSNQETEIKQGYFWRKKSIFLLRQSLIKKCCS